MQQNGVIYCFTRLACPAASGLWVSDTGLITGDESAEGYHWRPDYVCPHILVEGRGTVRALGEEFRLGPGDMFTLWPDVDIRYSKDEAEPWKVHWLHLVGPLAEQYGEACGFHASRAVLRPPRPEEAIGGFRAIYEHFKAGETASPYHVLEALYHIAGACGDVVHGQAEGGDCRKALVARAQSLIDNGPPGALNISELATALQVSRTTLFLAFREVLGATPIEHLTRRRIERSKDLMRRTHHPLDVIAKMAGFGEPKYFLRRFKQIEGITPSEWRRRGMPPS